MFTLAGEKPYLDQTDDVWVEAFVFNQLCQDPFNGWDKFEVSFQSKVLVNLIFRF